MALKLLIIRKSLNGSYFGVLGGAMKNRILISGLLGILLFAYDAASAADRQFSVFVSIPIKNELTDHVRSTVTRELQKLPDIKLVDELLHEKGQYVISIVALPFKLPGGDTVGIALSYVFQDCDKIMHGVLTGFPDDLENLSEVLVSICYFKLVEPNRRE
jgi:hypothetical protein